MTKCLDLRGRQRYVEVDPSTGCWLWLHARRQDEGKLTYGMIVVDGKQCRAHRYLYSLYVGDIPEGHDVLHRCDTPACVNPEHLFTGTDADNHQDKARKGRAVGGLRDPDVQRLGTIAAKAARDRRKEHAL